MKPIYFISDAHLGCRAMAHNRTRERRLVRFLDSIRDKAGAVYMLGDMFDFWYEYRESVPKGYMRFLGKVSELTDAGVEVHFFVGNHDLWCGDYLTKECGCVVHHQPETVELGDKVFFLAHGDGLGDRDPKFQLLRAIFHNRTCQWLFRWLHPDVGINFGMAWAAHSRRKHLRLGVEQYKGEDEEPLVLFAKKYLLSHPTVNYFIFGHRHIELDLMLSHTTRLLVLGDWIDNFTFGVFDGEQFWMENYIEGDTEP